jgi:hypothetical protein
MWTMRIQAPWNDLLAEPLAREHFVQLYKDDHVLAEAVSLFVGVGLGKSEAAVVVATPEHIRAIEERLASRGFNVEDLKRWGQLTVFEAAPLLSRFMVDGLPDPTLFKQVASEGLAPARAAGRYRKVRVYGEMVNLLWRDNLRAAVRLETLWNELIETHAISLFCAYGLGGDPASQFPPTLRALHAHLIPVEACS